MNCPLFSLLRVRRDQELPLHIPLDSTLSSRGKNAIMDEYSTYRDLSWAFKLKQELKAWQ